MFLFSFYLWPYILNTSRPGISQIILKKTLNLDKFEVFQDLFFAFPL